MNYNSRKTLGLNTTHGAHEDHFQRKGTMSKVTMPKPNQTSINSQDNLIYYSTKGSNVVVHVDPLDPTSFMS